MNIEDVFLTRGVVGIVGDRDSGKSNLLYYVMQRLREKYAFNLYSYGLRVNVGEKKIHSVRELERIENGVVFVDEFPTLFNLENRKVWQAVQNTFQFISHKNIVLVLCGLPENYHKFVSAKLDTVVYKRCTIADFINRSKVKNTVDLLSHEYKGSEILGIPNNKAIIYYRNELHDDINIPYVEQYDTKKNNKPIFTLKETQDEKI